MTTSSSFLPGAIWPDNKGVHINAHSAGVLYHEGQYYWFGEHKIQGDAGNRAEVGVHVYSSKDLTNWTDEGIALEVSDDPESDIVRGCIIERPKVIYNAKTGKFVMWFHLELKGQGYKAARAGVAVSDKVTGPYTYLRSFRPNAGVWPQNLPPEERDADSVARAKAAVGTKTNNPGGNLTPLEFHLAHHEDGQMCRDMTLFVDDDGKAYHLYTSEANATLHISQLTDDYLDHAGIYVRAFPGRYMEAPAICKRGGRYWFIASDCTGWDPNPARAAVADSIFGPWTELGNPCTGTNPENGLGPEKTFGGQSTYILPVAGKKDAYIALFDIWRPKNAIDGRYVWLPMRFTDTDFEIAWRNEWTLADFD